MSNTVYGLQIWLDSYSLIFLIIVLVFLPRIMVLRNTTAEIRDIYFTRPAAHPTGAELSRPCRM
jgi:hypothetical protein